jgi:hypothetical protein
MGVKNVAHSSMSARRLSSASLRRYAGPAFSPIVWASAALTAIRYYSPFDWRQRAPAHILMR